MRNLIFIFLSSLLLVTGCQSRQVAGESVSITDGSYQNISPDELNIMMKNKDFILVNVHIPFAGNIPGTDLSIPYDQIAKPNYLSKLPADKNAKIILYCRSGRMSAIAAETLVGLGYTNIWNLDGGMAAWQQSGYKIER